MAEGGRARGGRTAPLAQSGATTILLAISLIAMLAVSAIIVDVGAAYGTKRQSQRVADFSALAAARDLPGDPTAACAASWSYLRANLRDLPSGASSPCANFPSTCDGTSTAADYVAGRSTPYAITMHFPVPDGDPLLGAPRTMDGSNQCGRIGVVISHQNLSFFAGVVGGGALTPRAAAVARQDVGTQLVKVANLVVLDPHGCVGIDVQGMSTKVLVGTATKPGAIGVDSDGSGCNGGQVTVRAPNTGAELWAQPTSGATPGALYLYGQPGDQATCGASACSQTDVANGRVLPQPLSEKARVTRAVVDYAYNCKATYPAYHGLTIPGCVLGTPAYIDSLVTQVNSYTAASPPPGYTVLTGHSQCTPSTETLAVGNYWVDCTNFNVTSGNTVTFAGGNVVFGGNVSVGGGGSLLFNTANTTSSLVTGCLTAVCLGSSSAGAAFVYLQNGNFSTTGGGTLILSHDAVYVTAGSGNYVSAASGGTESWIAPTEGPFKNLALWAETSSNKFQLSGGGSDTIDGVFFTPEANPFSISGGFTNPQTAQFLSFQLAVAGGSALTMNPDPTRLLLTAPTGSELIR